MHVENSNSLVCNVYKLFVFCYANMQYRLMASGSMNSKLNEFIDMQVIKTHTYTCIYVVVNSFRLFQIVYLETMQ